MPPGKNHLVAAQGGEAATKMCHGHLGRAPSRAGRPWHIAGRTLFGPTHCREVLAKKTRIYGIAMQGGEAATKMCHGHLGRAPSRAGRPWHIAGRTLFGPTHGGEILAKKTRIYGIAMQGGGAATKMCHGHLGRAPSRAGRPWHIAGRTLFGPTHGGEIRAKKRI